MSILYQKTNKCSTNFHESRHFDQFGKNQYLRSFLIRVYLRKLIPAKKKFRIHLQKLIRD